MSVAGYKFKFVKISSSLLRFGIVIDGLRHSDPEKTILDFIYIWRYNEIPKEKIVLDVAEWAKNISKKKTREYAEKYPRIVREIAELVIR